MFYLFRMPDRRLRVNAWSPYVGHHGWAGVYLDVALDWEFIADLIEDSYRMTAPKRLRVLLDQG